jgi:hypothetical protein
MIQRGTFRCISARILRYHGMNDASLQTVFRTVVASRLTYASPAWRGFITASDLRRHKRSGYCPSDLPDFDELLGKFCGL